MSDQLFSGAVATEQLVGRTEELGVIRTAVTASDQRFHCVLIRAEGGKGKTRLLATIATQIDDWDVAVDTVVLLPLIDVSDPLLHSISAFLDRVYQHFLTQNESQKLSREAFQVFETFAERLNDYRDARDSGTAYPRVMERRDDMIKAFERAYEQLTQHVRVVWVLDTMEQLFTAAPEIEELLKYDFGISSTDIGPSTFQWLYKFILRRPQKTTVLLAGRPDPGLWATKIEQSLELAETTGLPSMPGVLPAQPSNTAAPTTTADNQPVVHHIQLGNFSEAESLQYIQTLQSQFARQDGQAEIAGYLSDLSDDTPQTRVLHRLTEGNPIRLALYIDLLLNSSSFPEAMHRDPADFDQMDAVQREALRTDVDRALLTNIANNLGQTSIQILDYLSVMRRGLDLDRLVALSGVDRDEAQTALERLRGLSFVKYRRDEFGERYYLHDEFYSIYQREFTGDDTSTHDDRREHQRRLFADLIGLVTNQLRALNDQLLGSPASATPEEQEARRRLRIRRRLLQIEWLHYELYLNPRKAFNTIYLELEAQALSSNDPELNDQLQAEIEIFFFGGTERAYLNRLQTGLPEQTWDLLQFSVVHTRITNLIHRLIQSKKHPVATAFVEKTLADHRHLTDQSYPALTKYYATPGGRLRHDYFTHEWQAYGQFAAIYRGGQETLPAIESLSQIVARLEHALSGGRIDDLPLITEADLSAYFRFRAQNLVAQIYMYIGYAYATLNAFSEAKAAYQRADYILLRTPPDNQVAHAELKNNLARAMAELGATKIAQTLCDEGIRFSRNLGLEYRVALGLNTKALIYALDHQPEEAYRCVADALRIFRQLNEPRGIGLALIQVGEACRRRFNTAWDRLPTPSPRTIPQNLIAILREADTALSEAAEIFGESPQESPSGGLPLRVEQVNEPYRLIETRTYQGCLFRDWANAADQRPGDDLFDRAVKHFDEAIKLAEESSYQRLRLSALIDKAWLYKRIQHVEARKIAELALDEAPQHHLLTKLQPLDLTQSFDFLIFRELSKLESLFADLYEQEGAFATSLSHRARAITYLQLFSPYETVYLGINSDKLYRLLNETRKADPTSQARFVPQAKEIVDTYHLDALQPRIGPLRFLQLIQDSFAPLTDLSYVVATPESTPSS